ncbi:MAG: flavodoxin family protein [Ruminococcus sp.]|nr:flavodoxin family protein [Ruminococcus sp.]
MNEELNAVWDKTEEKKILVINGSPQGNASGTMRVTNAFLKGIEENSLFKTEIITLSKMNIKPCMGCLSCWGRTDGECVIRDDDVPKIKKKILDADVVIASFPLYFFGMPGTVKVLNDRLLSTMMPYRGEKAVEGEPFQEFRYDYDSKKFLFVSTCGFGEVFPSYNALLAQLDCIFGKGGYQALLCPQGKVFSTPELDERVDNYLEKYTAAGKEFAENGVIGERTITSLQKPIFNERRFKLLINEFWRQERKAGGSNNK